VQLQDPMQYLARRLALGPVQAASQALLLQ